MKLLTQEEGKLLRPGDFVKVYWYGPRKQKDKPDAATREYGGRTEYLESTWDNCEVISQPYETASDGYGVNLKDRGFFLVNHMEKL